MNPLRPSPRLLRLIATQLADAKDKRVRAWADAVDRTFFATSIVKTYRGGRLCGFEVWRHLAPAGEDPRRHKARLWFGLKHWRTELGYNGAALHMAKMAARRLRGMNRKELQQWWAERSKARRSRTKLLPDDHILSVRMDYTDLARMSHAFCQH